ncbi:MAG: serine/threonine protein kinase, partial [Myxococcales bacterium]|nr:serine/threonine protein kinase [Myxococcales bacterium]
LEGESLYDAMCRDRQMSPEVTLAIILQVARGLAKAHEIHIVHRDLKPENIFLTVDEDGHLLVKILDFGLAKFYDPVETKGASGRHARLTREGAVFGTPAYMSPEQVRGQAAADTRADLWALACITYECFTGATVWSTEDGVAMTFAQIATAPLPDPRRYRPDLSPRFTEWFERALSRDIEVRFQTVAAFADGLAAAFDYTSKGGGLDAALINRITHRASTGTDAEAITGRNTPLPGGGSGLPGGGIGRPPTPQPQPTPPGQANSGIQPVSGLQPPPVSGPQPSPIDPPFSGGGPSSGQQMSSPSAVELERERIPSLPPAAHRGTRRVVVALLFIAVVTVGIFVAVSESKTLPPPPTVKRFAGVALELASSEPPEMSGHKEVAKHPWLPLVRESQALIAQGEFERALSTLRRIYEQHRHGMIRNLMDQIPVAVAGKQSGARCQVKGYARPRRYDLLGQDRKPVDATAPTIVRGIDSAVMTWADSRDGQRHAYVVTLDEELRNRALDVDVTPEGSQVNTPTLLPVANRFVAAYWDASNDAGGVFLRWLGPDGVIAGAPVPVVPPKAGAFFADAARSNEGFVVAYADRVEADSVDLFYRVFDNELKAEGDPVRVTDYLNQGSQPARVREIRVARESDAYHFVYTFVRGSISQIRYMSVPVDTKPPGLEEDKLARERVLGTAVDVTEPSQQSATPALACTTDGCFVTWHNGRGGGAEVAFIDTKAKKLQWHKVFAPKGKHPTLGVSPSGDIQLAWVEGGRLTTASLGREGVGPASKVARVVGEHPPPAIAPGAKRGEWYIAWLDYESGYREAYAVRIECE